AAVVDREQVPAGQREQLAHAVRLQPAGDQAPAVEGVGALLVGVLLAAGALGALGALGGHGATLSARRGDRRPHWPAASAHARGGIRTHRLFRAANFKSADFANLSTRAPRS